MIVHSHEYDFGYNPAMPVIEIQTRRRANQPAITLTAIVDSGADATLCNIDTPQVFALVKSQERVDKMALGHGGWSLRS